jgi:hypothetical protein
MTPWSDDDLAALHVAHSLVLTVESEDAPSREHVEVGTVVVDRMVFVTAYRGIRSRWFRVAVDVGHGTIAMGPDKRPVLLAYADLARSPVLARRIWDAYAAKYGSLGAGIITAEAQAATLRIYPE